ncbi:MAG TPA: hypothetical protein VFJ24_06680 [Gaiellales bacterium]|nr:hypothetical protein [Gaiellales bacterium]
MTRPLIRIAALGVAAGCYSYRPLALTPYLGPDVLVVRGRYLSDSDAGVRLSVATVERRRGDETTWGGETVVLPTAAIASVDVRRLAKGRTILLAATGVGGLVVTSLAFSLTGGSSPIVAGGGHTGKQ